MCLFSGGFVICGLFSAPFAISLCPGGHLTPFQSTVVGQER